MNLAGRLLKLEGRGIHDERIRLAHLQLEAEIWHEAVKVAAGTGRRPEAVIADAVARVEAEGLTRKDDDAPA